MKTSHWLVLAGAVFLTGCAGVKDTTRTFKTVVIDAGHGGHDSGARSRSGVLEKDVALDVAVRLEEKLRSAGFHTVMTRRDDRFIPLNRRARISNAQRNAIFISIHFNHTRARAIRGVETYVHHRVARGIADDIESSVSTMTDARGVKQADFRVLRLARYPAVLVECGYLSNAGEARRANSAAYRDLLAGHIADALVTKRFGKAPAAETAKVASRPATAPGPGQM